MPAEIFHLTTVARALPGGSEISEAIGFPEVSALDDAEKKWRASLTAKVKGVLEQPEIVPPQLLHRRRLAVVATLDEVEVAFEATKRAADWQEPVMLRLQYVRWEEDDLWHGYVPSLGVHAFAPRLPLLVDRIKQHVRLVVLGKRKRVSLKQLAEIERTMELRVGQLEVSAVLKTPLQIMEASAEEPEKVSILEKVAEELPPLRSKPAETRELQQAAFEIENHLHALVEFLNGPHRASVLLVGPPGCGKTALVRELARRRRDFGLPETPFWSTSGARLMVGPIGFGMWQERCQQMCREISKTRAILHLNSLAELLEVGKATRGEQSIGSFLRPRIARGDVLAIAECTPEQLGALERNEPHLLAAFERVTVPESTPEETLRILRHVYDAAPGRVAENRTPASNAALARLHQLHVRYATYSARPGRPLRFLKNLLADNFPEKALTENQVISAFARETGLPALLLDDAVPLDLEQTTQRFAQRVIGQAAGVARVVDLLALIKARLARPGKPLASFLFIGPTGTGKTEMAKALAEFLFSDPNRIVRFDLNEFSDPPSVQRLLGGFDGEGLLTARVREQPFSVILLDEFEKADPSFFDLLLQVLGDGRLTDAAGRVADFCNSVVVMTSNLGAQGFQQGPAGFRAETASALDAQEHFTSAVRKFLRPEIYNRIDAIIPFQPLTREVVLGIARRHLRLLLDRDGLRSRPVQCEFAPEVAEHLATIGYSIRYGARPLKRAIERKILVPLSEALNQYSKDTPLSVNVELRGGEVRVEARARLQDAELQARRDQTDREFVHAVVEQRRKVFKLQHCSATSALENQLTMLESLERRLVAAKWKSSEQSSRLATLPKLKECLQAIAALSNRAGTLETEVLATLYGREAVDRSLFAPEMEAMRREFDRLLREVLRWQHKPPTASPSLSIVRTAERSSNSQPLIVRWLRGWALLARSITSARLPARDHRRPNWCERLQKRLKIFLPNLPRKRLVWSCSFGAICSFPASDGKPGYIQSMRKSSSVPASSKPRRCILPPTSRLRGSNAPAALRREARVSVGSSTLRQGSFVTMSLEKDRASALRAACPCWSKNALGG
jgi:ATP-dependent Clp protease ATP-binding subunit ClpC